MLTANPRKLEHGFRDHKTLNRLVLGSLIFYLKATRSMRFQLSGFYFGVSGVRQLGFREFREATILQEFRV